MSTPTVQSLAKPATALLVAAGALAAGKPLGSATTSEVAGYVTAAVGALVATHPTVKKTVKRVAAKTVKAVTPKPKPKPKPAGRIAMYDSVDVDGIPANATHIAAYVDGDYVTYAAAKARFPHATIVTLTVTGESDADGIDFEKGDSGWPMSATAPPAEALTIVVTFVKRAHARGVKRPIVYAQRSGNMPAVWAALKAAGIKRDDVRLWVADWTGQPHLPAEYNACQWINTASYDESLCGAQFFD